MKQKLLLLFSLSLLFSTAIAQKRNNIVGKIIDAKDNAPLAGATVLIKGTQTGTTSNFDGNFTLSAKPEDIVLVSFVGYVSQQVKVGNQNSLTIKLNPDQQDLNEVVVIGSRSNQARTNIETPVPVDIITSKEIVATGRTDLSQILSFIAPSVNSNRQTGGDGSSHINPLALRGVAPDQTLILVNGKRRHTSALVNVLGTPAQGASSADLDAIPVSAIERIEVLRDGAAAQYGSDAIAGVINIVLKSSVDQGQVTITTGEYNTSYRNKKDGFTLLTGVNYGFRLGEKGFINISGQINNRDATDRSGFYEYNNRLTGAKLYWFPYAVGTSSEIVDAKEKSVDRYSSARSGNGKQENASLFVNAALPLGNDVEFYAFGGISSKYSISPNNAFRFPNGTTTINSISSRYFPTIYPTGFLGENAARLVDGSFTAGIKGKANGWNVDFSNTSGHNRIDYTIQNTINASIGTSSPTKFNSGALVFNQNTTNIGLSQRFENAAIKAFNVAFGAEYRFENYQIIAGEEKSYKNYGDTTYISTVGGKTKGVRPAGAQVFPGYQPADAQNQYRHSIGLYGDVEAEISDKFLLTGALRYEKYSDFGDQLTWKTSTSLKLIDDRNSILESLSLRGAVSTGFRAPSLQQKYYSATTSIPQADGGLILSLVSNNDNNVTRSFGIPNLKAETSNNFSLGITSRIAKHFTATVDAYQIDIKNRITLTGTFDFSSINNSDATIKGAAQLVKGLLSNYPDVNAAQFFANAIDTKTKGIDVVLAYKNRVGAGTLNLSLAGNFTQTKVTDVHVPSGLTSSGTEEVRQYLSERIFFDRQQRGRYERGTPQSKLVLLAGYTWGRITPNVVVTRFGEYTFYTTQSNINSATGGRDQTFSPKTTTDISVNYQLNKSVGITLGSNNIFDVYPDQLSIANNQTGTVPWGTGGGQQFGFNGAFYYGRLTFNF
ncbi:TonB-dependent receptor [Arcicella lustrica]|uniref:TonB-dependent receptor n=1 Tax=Arcicella lustrica TaxID=2984196 RepID=A0ABU5SKF2_9BACT|nr:TonB-dependent receptor [Arcicella sp. DC25W]MEA5427766.1 TonB-dependent receptor [Arcicella sp. DC25W]